MVVDIYPVNPGRGIWSFTPQPNTSPVRVRAPKGTTRKRVYNRVVAISVPTADKLVRVRWSAGEVMWSVQRGSRQFTRLAPELAVV